MLERKGKGMKKFEKCKRVLSILLATLMVFQQSSIVTLAEEMGVEAQTVNVEETKPETSAPATEAPAVVA